MAPYTGPPRPWEERHGRSIEGAGGGGTALRQVLDAAVPFLERLQGRLVYDRAGRAAAGRVRWDVPGGGRGHPWPRSRRCSEVGSATSTASAGPRFFHFVIGGSTPASLAADWAVFLFDQNAFVRASSACRRGRDGAMDWLRELVGLPAGWGGAMTASATFTNFSGLALATHWWAERHGVDVTSAGLAGCPDAGLCGGYVHPSARKALQLLGHGKDMVETFIAEAGRSTWRRCGGGWANSTERRPC